MSFKNEHEALLHLVRTQKDDEIARLRNAVSFLLGFAPRTITLHGMVNLGIIEEGGMGR